jgi:hypothetical protein
LHAQGIGIAGTPDTGMSQHGLVKVLENLKVIQKPMLLVDREL